MQSASAQSAAAMNANVSVYQCPTRHTSGQISTQNDAAGTGINGSLGDYAGLSLKLPVITIELPQATQPPSAAQSGRIWSDLLAWLDQNVDPAPAH